ncbi:hypothetical protein OHB13_12065 [Streptomyces sp. NBC_00440]|uniref:hypothetical protein n=1 Tax=Streptomyces sp. NBC_00440 TaxID=2975741 RepID=UPI002E2022A8
MSTVSIDLPPYAKVVFKYGRPVVLLTALLMSIPGEVHLAKVAGWDSVNLLGLWTFNVAWLMPVCVSVYAACSAVIADVAKRLCLPNQRSAVAGAVAALLLALTAQDVSHLIQQDYMNTSWLLVGAVSAIPPLVAFHMLHMAAAPESTASEVEIEELEDTFEDDDDAAETPCRKGKPGRPGLSEDEVNKAIANLEAAGRDVTPETLGEVLGRAPRTARRYMAQMKRAELKAVKVAEHEAEQSAGEMLPLTI